MRTIELVNAGKYKLAEARFAAVDAARANRRKRILGWASHVAAMAIDQQHEDEHKGDLPGYRDCLEMDLCDAIRANIPNATNDELIRAVEAFRAALPSQFND
jgi:hypothetical protein